MAIDWNKIRGNINGASTPVTSSSINWDQIRKNLPPVQAPTQPVIPKEGVPVIPQEDITTGGVIKEAGSILGNLFKKKEATTDKTMEFPVGGGLTPTQKKQAEVVIKKPVSKIATSESLDIPVSEQAKANINFGATTGLPEAQYTLKGISQALRQKNVPEEAKKEVAGNLKNLGLSMGLTAPEEASASLLKKLIKGKTASQLIPEELPLINEAKKYKSAEEFVENIKPIYRGQSSNIFNENLLPTGASGKPRASFSTNKDVAESFGKNVFERYINPNAKILNKDKIPSHILETIKKPTLGTDEFGEIIKYARDNNYDAIDFSNISKYKVLNKNENEIRVLNPDILLTKSQLTDIWNRANISSKTKPLEIPKKLLPPKKDSLFVKAKETLAPIKAVDEESQAIYKNWVSRNLVGKELANKEAQKLASIPEKDGLMAILSHEVGKETPYTVQIQSTFDDLYRAATDRGIEIPYRQNYVPQMYNNTKEEVRVAVANYLKDSGAGDDIVKNYLEGSDIPEELASRLRLNPSFAGERVFPSYNVATKYGLEPRYTHPAQLAAAYRENLEAVTANKQLIQELVDNGKLVTSRSAVPGYDAPVSLAFSPKGYYAQPKLARALNNLSRDEANLGFSETLAKGVSKASKFMQEVALSAGFPKTDVNFFSIGQLIKQLTSRVGQATTRPLGALVDAGKDVMAFVRANSNAATIKWFESKAPVLQKMASEGIDVSNRVGQYRDMFDNMVAKKPLTKVFGDGWDNLFQKKTFASLMPMNYVNTFESTYKQALKQGMADDVASKIAGEVTKAFHGLTDNVARSKSTQDELSAIFFAPKFREGIINTLWNVGKSVTTQLRNPAYKKSRELAIGMAITYAGYNYLNKKLSGRYTWENETGREFSLRVPLNDGNVMYVEFMPSFLSLPRNLASAGIALSKLDLKTATQKGSSLLSMPIQIGSQIINNEDYFGNPIYKDTDTRSQKAVKIAQYLGLRANHPYLRLISDYIASKEDKEFKKPLIQSMIEAAEFPLKFNSLDRISRQEFYEAIDKITIGNADERKRVQPVYDKVQQLIKDGKKDEANQLIRNLSNKDYDIYKTIKTSAQRGETSAMEQKMFSRYQEIQNLITNGKKDEANKIVREMTNEEYHAYDLLRKRLKGQ